jgi:xanthine dehydrogenase accessory factor
MELILIQLAQAISAKEPAALVTVIEAKGASPAKVGAQLVLFQNGTTAGTVGGGKLESSILEDAKKDLAERKCGLHHYQLTEEGQDSIGTLCGGEVTAFVQPYFPPPQLVIVGGGHIGRPLKIMGETAGFDVVVVDVVPGRAAVPEVEKVKLSSDSYVVLITTDHISDEAAMRIALKTPAPYSGMSGSLAKWRTIRENLTADGYGDADLSRIFAPIGLDLGGPTPQEIAVAILAEVVAVRHHLVKENTISLRRLSVK